MMRFIIGTACPGALFTALMLLFTAPVHADSMRVTEAQIMEAAMQASPDFHAVWYAEAEEQADADQAGRLQNPTVDIGASHTSGRGGSSESYDIEIEQPLSLSQMTGARARLSQAMFERAALRRQHALIQAFWQTKILYAQAWQYQQQAVLYADFKKRAQDAAAKINKSVKAGQTAISDGSLFAGDAAKFSSDLEKIEGQQAHILLQLEKTTGLNLMGKTLDAPALAVFDGDIPLLVAQAQKNASLVRLLEADLKTAERQKLAANADSAGPGIAPRFMYERAPDNREDTVGVGVVLTIPLWDQNQSERRKASAARLHAQRQLDTLEALPLSERLARASGAVERLDRRIQLLAEEALPNYRKSFDQAQKSFNAGQADATALWQIRERLFETERELLDATLDAIDARRILSLETGIMPQEALL